MMDVNRMGGAAAVKVEATLDIKQE